VLRSRCEVYTGYSRELRRLLEESLRDGRERGVCVCLNPKTGRIRLDLDNVFVGGRYAVCMDVRKCCGKDEVYAGNVHTHTTPNQLSILDFAHFGHERCAVFRRDGSVFINCMNPPFLVDRELNSELRRMIAEHGVEEADRRIRNMVARNAARYGWCEAEI